MNSAFKAELYSPISFSVISTAIAAGIICTIFYKYSSNLSSFFNQKPRKDLTKKCENTSSTVSKNVIAVRERINSEKASIIKVTDKVHVAKGYGLANCIVIQGMHL